MNSSSNNNTPQQQSSEDRNVSMSSASSSSASSFADAETSVAGNTIVPQEVRDRLLTTIRTKAADTQRTLSNAAINTTVISTADSILSAIPLFGTVAKATSDALAAALNTPPLPVNGPQRRNTNDPIKMFAITVILAILQMFWCLIKTILNPIPVIGPALFPLCDPDPSGTPEQKQDAAVLQPKTANNQSMASIRARLGSAQRIPRAPVLNLPDLNVYQTTIPVSSGTSWEEYVSSLPPRPIVAIVDPPSPAIPSSSALPVTPQATVTPIRVVPGNVDETDELRKSLGL